jgi:hypothetical protein
MLKSGKYLAEHNNSIFDQYRIVMSVRETEKSYIFELLEYVSHYGPAQIDMLFAKSKRVVISKSRGGHAIRIWSDHDFTFYPFQYGIPFYFEWIGKDGDVEGSDAHG